MAQWDPAQYLRFGSERTRPVLDLIHRIRLDNPHRILDLGCGPGNSTEALRARWPASTITGLDNSAKTIGHARQSFPQGNWIVGDASFWRAEEPFDLVFSNAALQWIPNHETLCRQLFEQAAPGGALAVQVPAHYDSPLHLEILEVSRDPRWDSRMERARRSLTNHPPEFYYDLLAGGASSIDLWESIYYHVLPGPEGVLEWFRGTGLRPYLEALPDGEERRVFEDCLLARYRQSYPMHRNHVILFPFRRLFFVAYR
jgi:trans-aconitate 2-methyltransferase